MFGALVVIVHKGKKEMESLLAQLSSCVESYRQVNSYLSSIGEEAEGEKDQKVKKRKHIAMFSPEEREQMTQFFVAKENILSAILSLNFLLEQLEEGGVNKEGEVHEGGGTGQSVSDVLWAVKGRICWAFREAEGIEDLCLLLEINPAEEKEETSDIDCNHRKHQKMDDEISSMEVKIHWVYPRNTYELQSQGIIMTAPSFLRGRSSREVVYSASSHDRRVKELKQLQIGDRVMVMNEYLFGSYSLGILRRRVLCGLSRSVDEEKQLSVKLVTFTDSTQEDDDNYTNQVLLDVPENILKVFPIKACRSSGISVSSRKDPPKRGSNDKQYEWEGFSEDSDVDSDDHKPTISNVPLVPFQTVKRASWEVHTKGIGSRLMAKMGFKEGAGLGPNAKGRLQPIEASTILPPGLSLDYISDIKKRQILLPDGRVRMLKKEVADADNKDARPKKRSRRKKKMAQHISQPRGDLFDFLNDNIASRSVSKHD